MFTLKRIILNAILIASASVHAGESGILFKFKFRPDKPLVYSVETKSKTVNDSSAGNNTSLTSTTVDTRYKFKLTAVSINQDGTTKVHYEPFDFEQDVDKTTPSGHVTVSTRGLDIMSKLNGIVMVDTAKGIGIAQENTLKYPIYPNLISGYFDMSADGDIKGVHGDLPFIDYWDHNRKFNLGLFQIIFSSNSIGVHDSWTNCLTLKSAGGVFFNNGGIVQSNVFIRELDSESNACFSLYESDNYRDISGYIEQYGEQTSMAIPQHTESMNGTFHFDPQSGCLADMQRTSTTHDEFNMMVRGNSANSQTDFDLDVSMKLISP